MSRDIRDKLIVEVLDKTDRFLRLQQVCDLAVLALDVEGSISKWKADYREQLAKADTEMRAAVKALAEFDEKSAESEKLLLRIVYSRGVDQFEVTRDAFREFVRRTKNYGGAAALGWLSCLYNGWLDESEKQPTWRAERVTTVSHFPLPHYSVRIGHMAADMSQWEIWNEV